MANMHVTVSCQLEIDSFLEQHHRLDLLQSVGPFSLPPYLLLQLCRQLACTVSPAIGATVESSHRYEGGSLLFHRCGSCTVLSGTTRATTTARGGSSHLPTSTRTGRTSC